MTVKLVPRPMELILFVLPNKEVLNDFIINKNCHLTEFPPAIPTRQRCLKFYLEAKQHSS